MHKILILAVVGFLAELVDGSLGMAYGLTSASLLLAFGVAPVLVSASVHMAEIFTTAAAGVSHIKFGNVDKRIVKQLIIPGAIGAFLGAILLTQLPGETVKPYIAFFMFVIGMNIIFKFAYKGENRMKKSSSVSRKFLSFLGFGAGLLDSIGGGGWGPITTPVLMSKDSMEPRKIIGSVDTSEFVVTLSATLGFMLSLGLSKIDYRIVLALIAGGVLAAPIAAWVVRIIPQRFLGVVVGGVIILTNAHVFINSLKVSLLTHNIVLTMLGIAWAFSLGFYIGRRKEYVKVT